jgi:hypothetical protein
VNSADNNRLKDKSSLNKSLALKNIESGAEAYAVKTVVGAPIGQERDVLRLLYEFGYPEFEINLVRDAFKTSNVFLKRDVDQAKRMVMQKVKAKQPFQTEATNLVAIAKKIETSIKQDLEPIETRPKLLLGYIVKRLNA